MRPLEPDTLIQGRYEIRELIGKGGMGQVYLAIDQRLGHKVALKRTTVGDDATLTDAFENEARTLAQLRHPYLPKVSDHFLETDEQFLVMEYISGDDLNKRLKQLQKPFPLNWVLFWADELLEALNYLHTHSPPIIHRDIKPQNLKLTDDNHVVLLDFGLSKHALGQTRLTTSGSVVGYTPHYAPLEQIRGTGTNALSDIYALCATLYHLLTNRVPPDALTRADALLSDLPDPLRPLTEINGEITDSISETIIKGMEISQDKRFSSAREMQKALRNAYNELQQSMSAETVAFNLGDAGAQIGEPSGAGEKTEVIPADIVPSEPPAEIPQTPPQMSGQGEEPSMEKTEVIDPAELRAMAESSHQDLPEEPESISGEKTEVIPPGSIEIPAPPVSEVPEDPYPTEVGGGSIYETSDDIEPASGGEAQDYSTSEDFAPTDYTTSEDAAAGTEIPDATIPAISLESQESDSEPAGEAWDASFVAGHTPIPGGESEVGEIPGYTEVFDADVVEEEPEYEEDEPIYEAEPVYEAEEPAAAPVVEKQESSTGKYIAILGGLAAILLLFIGSAFAVGWYYYNGGFGLGSPTPDPSPIESPGLTPEQTPFEPTPEESIEVPSPEESVTPEEEGSPTPGTNDPRTTRTPSRTPRKTPVKTPTRGTPTPRPTRKPTPKTLPTILQ